MAEKGSGDFKMVKVPLSSDWTLKKFDPSVDEWSIFDRRLQSFFERNDVPEENQNSMLLNLLNQELLISLPMPDELDQKSYNELRHLLHSHFSPKACVFNERANFYKAKRSPDESIADWATRVKHLAQTCQFGEHYLFAVLDKFVMGLEKGKVKERLFSENPGKLTLDTARDIAQQTARCLFEDSLDKYIKSEPAMYKSLSAKEPWRTSVSTTDSEKKIASRPSSSSECESVSTLSGSEGAYDTDELRRALVQHGFAPGPITANTKRVYLRKLKRCRKKPLPPLPSNTATPAFSPELLKTLSQPCEHLLAEWAHLEDSMSASFSCARRPWREGQAKTSFTYLLLDPRVAHSLPARAAANLKDIHSLWREFLKSVFYVGKGKRSRPYAHLYQAVSAWQQQKSFGYCKKIQRILDIWKSGEGVICLHVFLNVIPVEAFTREAAMICAMTLPQLTNEQVGKFYGSAASWSERLKRRLGCVLLHRAFKVFLAEGERQLRPADID